MSGPYDYYDGRLDVWISGYAPLREPDLEPPAPEGWDNDDEDEEEEEEEEDEVHEHPGDIADIDAFKRDRERDW